MALGRPTGKKRAPFGQRLNQLRQQAGLTQRQVAEKLGMSQRAYSHWERQPVALRPEQMLDLAQALNVSLDELIGGTPTVAKKRGPKSQLEKQLEAIASLPRAQQQRILDVVQALIAQATS
jgi:transcriptional regulator with XRE-family HTH domain